MNSTLLHRGQSEMRMRKRRLVAMLRAYRAAAMALPDAGVVLDRNSQRVQWCNPAASTLLGLHYPRDIGASLSERLQPLSLARWLAAGRNAEPLMDTPSPVDPDLRLSLRLIPYSEELWLLVARDVSKLMRLEQMRRDFVANVSHELRTPLTVVHGYLDLLDPADQPEWAPMLAEMQRQSQRMTQLVEDLLSSRAWKRRKASPKNVGMAPCSTRSRRSRSAEQGRLASSSRRHARRRRAAGFVGPRRNASAFSNLVSTPCAIRPQAARSAAFRARNRRRRPRRDGRGYAIPAAHLRAHESFYRVSTSRSRESGGTGLGWPSSSKCSTCNGAPVDRQRSGPAALRVPFPGNARSRAMASTMPPPPLAESRP